MLQGKFGVLVKGGAPLDRASAATLKLRDNLRMGDTTQTPLEYVYEAADCRLSYTADMVLNATETWSRVAEAQWGSKGNGASPLCVKGSTGHPSAGSRAGIPWGVEDQKYAATIPRSSVVQP